MGSWRRRLRSRYTVIALSAVIGSLCAIGACFFVLSWEDRLAENEFESKAKGFIETVNTDLGDASTMLYTIAAFIGAHDHTVTASEFTRFAQVLHRRVVGLRDAGWAPRITFAERPAFERDQARETGLKGFTIRQRGPHGRLVLAPIRPVYYPIQYIEAVAAKRAVLGIDLIAESVRARAIRRALATGLPAATPPIDIVTIGQPAGGFLGYMVVQNAHPQPVPAAIDSERGVVFGIFEIAPMIADIISKAHADGLLLDLFDPAAAANRSIYRSPSASGTREPTRRALLAGMHWRGTIVMIDQRWGAIVTPRAALSLLHWSGSAAAILLAGLTMTATIVVYLFLSERRTFQLERLTASLRATTLDLNRRSEQISYLSRHDELTGLPNRILFSERMSEAVERSRRGIPFSLLCLDLDRFKAVNDTLGHSAGDLLLRAAGERMNACLRAVDTAARLGGDEFAIVLTDTANVAEIEIVTGRLIQAVGEAYSIDGRSVLIGVSIGVAISTAAATAESLLKNADLALYEAKAKGRGVCCYFDEQMLERAERRGVLAANRMSGGSERIAFTTI